MAVADALINISTNISDDDIKKEVIKKLRYWGNKYPFAKYGQKFILWLGSKNPKPYASFGNGSAMRVSRVGWLFNTLEQTNHVAKLTAEITHNHEEGIKGAQAIASSIFLLRNGATKKELRDYIETTFNYNLSRTLDEIRPSYFHKESCQESVPEDIISFLEGFSYEDVIRNAISLGGDSDTLACMGGSNAESFYKIPESFKVKVNKIIPQEMKDVINKFYNIINF